jgi:hypothetical protein
MLQSYLERMPSEGTSTSFLVRHIYHIYNRMHVTSFSDVFLC